MTAKLFRSGGSWWLEYEDGWQRDTHHKAGRDGFRRREMTRTVCPGRTHKQDRFTLTERLTSQAVYGSLPDEHQHRRKDMKKAKPTTTKRKAGDILDFDEATDYLTALLDGCDGDAARQLHPVGCPCPQHVRHAGRGAIPLCPRAGGAAGRTGRALTGPDV